MSQGPLLANSLNENKTQAFPALLSQASRSIADICSASDECVMRLDEIEEQLEGASGIEGMRVLRFRLEECLQKLREETRRHREEISQALARLRRQCETVQAGTNENGASAPELDKISGLELRDSAEEAVAAAMQRGGLTYGALFVVDRLHLINAQFGYSTGDRILREFSEHLRSALLPKDQLFRWTGPAFLAIIERGESPVEVETDVRRIAGGRLEAAVQIGNGCVRLPIVRTSLLLPLSSGGSLADLIGRLDEFTGLRARH